ncbi:unnamed protein product [Tilletia controversa]|uniref:Uncharacterized protein n=3 Tax=Tilletia TaxID=13289 RepID=A0A8X7MLJ1_9BASI|nr:hypothetical protein CF336_g8219 [Tilletia laevis]KAE8185926.1 hypothetical protein CF328_g7394 [Tilletia controversa]KAE8243477.1 hypothetical protein A4X03_0g7754 [Tilletia caries]KAE8185358.1 hypothetical protein CF335_g7746 [Tilletia laevis]KAE8239823.1 hypothetical protein A4X06_0g8023 [Tilletia controversa]
MAYNITALFPGADASSALGTDSEFARLYFIEQAVIPFVVRNLCIQIAFSSAVVTLYVCLLYMSQAHHRRTWTFALVTLVAGLFFVTAFTNSSQLTHTLVNPTKKVPLSIGFCDAFITLCLPWVADWVISLRAVALVPVRDRRKPKYIAFGVLVLSIKIVRGVALILLGVHIHTHMRDSMSPADLGTKVWPISSLTWVEYGGMLVDTSLCSAICAWRLTNLMTPSRSSRSKAVQERLRLLLFNTISSFIFPAVSALVMIILAAVSTFEAYSSLTKINSGIVSLNVLIAMLIPIIDANTSGHRQLAQRDAAITDSFLRNNRVRSLSLSHPNSPRHACSIAPAALMERLELGMASTSEKEVIEMERRGEVGDKPGSSRLRKGSVSFMPRPGTAGSLVTASYEPSMVEKTPVLDFSEEHSLAWNVADGSTVSLGATAEGRARSDSGPVPSHHAPASSIADELEIQQQIQQLQIRHQQVRYPPSAQVISIVEPAVNRTDSERSSRDSETGQLATTDEHRSRLRSMPRRTRT